MAELPCNSCKHGGQLHLNRYGEYSGGCWRFFICYNPKHVKLKAVEIECSCYERVHNCFK